MVTRYDEPLVRTMAVGCLLVLLALAGIGAWTVWGWLH